MAKAYLLTYLTRQFFLSGAALGAKHPHCWLVWEPGSWKAPAYDERTVLPRKGAEGEVDPSAALSKGDALCFSLNPPAAERPWLRVGRASESELVINDGTVSREHLLLRFDPGSASWRAELTSQSKATTYRGAPFPSSGPVGLRDGDSIGLGEISQSYHDSPGFIRRLELEVGKQLGRTTRVGS